ncbi:hypothetical protein [Ramlibacter sp. PS4R-6]|uniref:hypothetical protein n=1 Tax=Ramlibacter sp. PS4R-6 TaxID=3133438 RepID=UPI0030A623CC
MTVQAQPSSCSSDGVAQPAALLERFVNADCDSCWGSPQAPEAAAGSLAIDWVVPGSRGDDAPLSAVAVRDAQERLDSLRRKVPPDAATQFTARTASPYKLRIAHGLPINDYIGVAIEVSPPAQGATAWLLLVETLPKGTEGSAVERNLVRNTFVTTAPGRYEIRSMQIPEGAQPSRLRVVGWLEDSGGKIRAIAQSRCRKG